MLQEALSPRKNTTCDFAGPKPEELRPETSRADCFYHSDAFRQDLARRFELDRTFDLTLSIPEGLTESALGCEQMPMTPPLLSPISSASGLLSTREDNLIWDSPQMPQTPLQHLHQANKIFSTPLTPPDSCAGASEATATPSRPIHPIRSRKRTPHVDEQPQEWTQKAGLFGLEIRSFDSLLNSSAVESSVSLLYESGLASICLSGTCFDHNDDSPSQRTDHAASKICRHDAKYTPASSPRSLQSHHCQSSMRPRLIEDKTDLLRCVIHKREVSSAGVDRRSKRIAVGFKGKNFGANSASKESRLFSTKRTVVESPLDLQQEVRLEKFFRTWNACLSRRFTAYESRRINSECQKIVLKTGFSQFATRTGDFSREADVRRKTSRSFKKLEDVLEHILPFDLVSRIAKHPQTCVATKRDNDRCSSPALGDSQIAKRNMKMVSHCIKLFKYMALPDHIEELVKNKTCGIHRKVAIEQPMAESRLDTLRALVILIPDLTESDSATLSTWLQAISGIETSPYAFGHTILHYHFTPSIRLCRLLNRIVPFCMHVKLSQKPNRCVRLDCKELPLKSGKNDESRQSMIDKLVKQSAQCVKDLDFTTFTNHVERLARLILCSSHQELACSKMKMLQSLLRNIAHLSGTYLAIVKAWIEAFTKCNLPTTFGTGSESSMKITKAALQPKVVDAPTDTAIILPASSFKFAPYQTEPSSIRSIAEALFAKASKALSAWDRKDGYIYMFWDQQHFGMVKVGRTADREQRLKQWNSQCKITHHYHRILKDTSSSRIPHVQRIEKLLHIELGNYRKKRTCDGCGRTHIEWFDISAEKARQVYQKWEDWIVQRPYAQDKAGNWVIRPEMLGSLSEVCKPVVFSEPIKVVRPRLSVPRTRSKPRKSLVSR